MWGLIHIKGCGGVCYFRSSKPFTHTKVDEKDSFNWMGVQLNALKMSSTNLVVNRWPYLKFTLTTGWK